jgi:DNA-binding NarL/FixJ family response regulator
MKKNNALLADDLINGNRQTQDEKARFNPDLAKRLTKQCPIASWRGRPVSRLMALLTARELEVWRLIAEGLATKQIAYALFISYKTVEKHRQHLMEKLNIHHVAGLTRFAIAEGIIKAVPDDEPGMFS